MSAPALRPTARMRPVLRDHLERQLERLCEIAVGLAVMALYLRVGLGHELDMIAIFCLLLPGFLMATPHEQPPVWDAALPLEPARYALVRLVCGVVCTACMLGVVVGLYAALSRDPGHPGWYPLALFVWGLTFHLLMSAALLASAARAYFLTVLMLCPLAALVLAIFRAPAELGTVGVTAVLALTALPLALAAATAYAAARFLARVPALTGARPRRERAHAGPSAPSAFGAPGELGPRRIAQLTAPERDTAREVAAGSAPRAVRRGPYRRPATLTVFRRHCALLLRVTVLPAATLLFFAVFVVLMTLSTGPADAGEVRTVRYFVEFTGLGWVCVWMALSWTVLVWLREHGAQRRWNDTLPVGTGVRRVLHAAAGTAWLLLFVAIAVAAPVGAAAAAGTLASPADVPAWLWLGLPCRTLTLYLAATLVLFGTRLAFQTGGFLFPYTSVVPYVLEKVLPVYVVALLWAIMMLAMMVGMPSFFFMLGIGLLANMALGVAGDASAPGWTYAAPALWLVLYAAAAAASIALNDWIHQRDRLPTPRELRGFLHRWMGPRPGPPLHGHAAR